MGLTPHVGSRLPARLLTRLTGGLISRPRVPMSQHFPIIESPDDFQLESLAKIAKITSISHAADFGPSRVAELCRDVADALRLDACVIRLLDGDVLVLAGQYGFDSKLIVSHLEAYGAAEEMLRTLRPLAIEDVEESEITAPHHGRPTTVDFRSFAGAPMIAGGEVVGLIATYSVREVRRFCPYSLASLQIVANHAAVLFQNAALLRAMKTLNRDLDRRIESRTQELAEANQRLEEFAYRVAHDIRGPLRGIASTSRMLLDDYGRDIDQDGRDLLRRQIASTRHLSQLTSMLLDLAEIEKCESRPQLIDVGAVAQELFDEMAPLSNPAATLRIEPIQSVIADPSLVRFTLQNLIENALKFSAQAKRPEIVIGPGPNDSVCVADNGIGFPSADAERIFDDFSRLDNANKFKGTGIGLSTVRRVLDANGGKIWAESSDHGGARFMVQFPTPHPNP